MKRIALILTLAFTVTAYADQRPVNFQGRLVDDAGNPVTSNAAFSIAIFNVETNGSSIYSEDIGLVPVKNGVYGFAFGTNAAFVDVLTNEFCYLEVVVAGDTLAPRHRLLAVPYALDSERLGGIEASAYASYASVPTGQIVASHYGDRTSATLASVLATKGSTPATVILDGAEWVFNESVVIPANTHIVGVPPGVSITFTNGNVGHAFTASGANNITLDGLSFSNSFLSNSDEATLTNSILRAVSGQSLVIKNLRSDGVFNALINIALYDGVDIRNCHFRGFCSTTNEGPWWQALKVYLSEHVDISHNIFETGSALPGTAAIYVNSSTGVVVSENRVVGPEVPIYCAGGNDVAIKNNICRGNNFGDLISVGGHGKDKYPDGGDMYDFSITGNVLSDGTIGIVIGNGLGTTTNLDIIREFVVSDNLIKNVYMAGIQLYAICENGLISDNQIVNDPNWTNRFACRAGIELLLNGINNEGSHDIRIAGNLIENWDTLQGGYSASSSGIRFTPYVTTTGAVYGIEIADNMIDGSYNGIYWGHRGPSRDITVRGNRLGRLGGHGIMFDADTVDSFTTNLCVMDNVIYGHPAGSANVMIGKAIRLNIADKGSPALSGKIYGRMGDNVVFATNGTYIQSYVVMDPL